MQRNITFIHAADLHLDSPFQGLAKSPEQVFEHVQASTFQAFENLIDIAIEKDVDFVLLVGDIFDENLQSLKALIKLRQAFERLQSHNIYVYMSYGNHDYIKGHVHQINYPENVFVFPDERVTALYYPDRSDPLAAIYGFSYEQRNITSRKAREYPKINEEIPFHIATLHGSLHGDSTHATYAPFSLNELIQQGYDYWALGHIHKRQILHDSPPIVYPGNIQGRHPLEGGAKGCYHVELTQAKCELTFIPLHTIEFVFLEVPAQDCQDVFALEQIIEKQLIKQIKTKVPTLIKLHLIGNAKLYLWEREKYIAEIIEVINDRYLAEDQWFYIYDIEIEVTAEGTQQSTAEQNHFFQVLNQQFSDSSITPLLEQLYKHPQARKFLQPLSQADELHIQQKAKHLLTSELFKTRER